MEQWGGWKVKLWTVVLHCAWWWDLWNWSSLLLWCDVLLLMIDVWLPPLIYHKSWTVIKLQLWCMHNEWFHTFWNLHLPVYKFECYSPRCWLLPRRGTMESQWSCHSQELCPCVEAQNMSCNFGLWCFMSCSLFPAEAAFYSWWVVNHGRCSLPSILYGVPREDDHISAIEDKETVMRCDIRVVASESWGSQSRKCVCQCSVSQIDAGEHLVLPRPLMLWLSLRKLRFTML